MRVLIITQDEPFYLYDNLKLLFKKLPEEVNVVGCVISDVSPFGKKEKFFQKALKTFKIFGHKFFLYYSTKFIYCKLFKPSIQSLLITENIPEIKINGSINSISSLKKISSYKPDLIVSILGNQIFKKKLINLPTFGSINLHTALLPKYRGLMPTFWVMKNNEKFTGVSVFFIDEGIDSGPILVQKKIEIKDRSQAELIKLTKKIGMSAIVDAISLIISGEYKLINNPNDQMTYYSFPDSNDVKEFLKSGKTFF